RFRPLAFLRIKGGGFVESPRCTSLEGGFSLWKEYVAQARAMIAELPAGRALSLCYEEVLENPHQHLRRSADFCGLAVTDSQLGQVVGSIAADRANSYISDSELARFASERRAELGEFDYNA